MKIKFHSDDLPLKKTLALYNIIIIVTSAFHEGNKYYPHKHCPQPCQINVCINQLICDENKYYDSIIMLRFGGTKVVKEELYGTKKSNKYLGFQC